MTEIKVLNIAQPHAHDVMYSGKNIENRTMISNYRGTIAIYASATYQKTRFESSKWTKDDCSFGCIIGFVDIVDCITQIEVTSKTKKWFMGPYGYVFTNPRILENPIKVKPPQGAIVWWDLDGKSAKECLDQIEKDSIIELTKVKPDKSKPKPKIKNAKSLLVPSKALAAIVGSEAMNFKAVFGIIGNYIEKNEIMIEDDNNGNNFLILDKKLQAIFKSKKVNMNKVRDLLFENLNFPK